MASTIYSTQFIAEFPVPGSVARTVPAGVVWVLRCMDLTDETGDVDDTIVVDINGGQLYPYSVPTTLTQDHHTQWNGHQVLNPGDILAVSAYSGSWAAFLSGYVLTAP